MPNDEDFLFGQLEDVFKEVENDPELVDLTTLTIQQLLELRHEAEQYVLDNRQTLRPQTQEARDAHSRRNAVQLELRRRGYDV